jgi:hypothetical protein
MNVPRTRMSWSARLLIGLVLILAGAAVAVWSLAHYQPAARFLGIVPAAPPPLTPKPIALTTAAAVQPPEPQSTGSEYAGIAQLEERLSHVENSTKLALVFGGSAYALVVAFDVGWAIDRGVDLVYLE